jgi:hypothetical protein
MSIPRNMEIFFANVVKRLVSRVEFAEAIFIKKGLKGDIINRRCVIIK